MLAGGGVPVRQHERRDLSLSRLVHGRIPLAVDNVVFRIWRFYGTRKAEYFSVQLKIGGPAVGEKLVARLEDGFIQDAQILSRSVTVTGILFSRGPVGSPFETPVERPDDPIRGAETEAVFPVLHPSCVQSVHRFTTRVARRGERAPERCSKRAPARAQGTNKDLNS